METKNLMNRRRFLQSAALTTGVLAMDPMQAVAAKKTKSAPDQAEANRSNFKGVQIGAISYSYRDQGNSGNDALAFSLGAGLGSVELMGGAAADFVGKRPKGMSGAEYREYALKKYAELARIYKMAGIDIHIIKHEPNQYMSDEDLDYVFEICKAVGAMGVTTELDLDVAYRVAPFAEKHGKYLIFHNHGQPADSTFPGFDAYLNIGKNIMLNFDAGHYFGFTGKNPCDIIRKYHNRIASIHLKDKTRPDNPAGGNQNRPWGQGETPLAEILTLVSENAGKPDWPTHCDIELEYPVPEGSTSMEEVAKCVEYCRNILK